MNLANSFIKLLGAYIERSTLKEKNKYKDRFLRLERQYIKEISKDEELIDTNAIDHILIELRQLSEAATTAE